MITVGEAARIIAPHVERTFPNDREAIFDILNLVKEKIWQTGKFSGSTKWMWVKVRDDGSIITPHGYNILLGCRTDKGPPLDIRDQYFIFHKNGPASSAPIKDNNYTSNVISLGQYPTLLPPDFFGNGKLKDEFKLSVVSPNCGNSREFNTLRVFANDKFGNKIYSYIFKENEDANEELKILIADDIDQTDGVIEGINFPIKSVDFCWDNVIVSSIYGIIKEPTRSPVEVWIVDCKRNIKILAARLEPNETTSSYNLYKIPNIAIRNKWVYGLFKMSKPQPISFDSELFLIDNQTALINIAKGVYKMTYKDQLIEGKAFVNEGISSLNDELREEKPNSTTTLQIDSFRSFIKQPKF